MKEKKTGKNRDTIYGGDSAIPPGRMFKTDVTKGKECTIPNAPGVYRHVSKETRQIDYVGMTKDLQRRQQQHEHTGNYDPQKQYINYAVANVGVTKAELLNTEKYHINKYNPPRNIRK